MSSIGSWELQKAIVTSLKADATVTALVSDRVYDEPPQGATLPYIVVGEGAEADSPFMGEGGHAVRPSVECWTSDSSDTTATTGSAGYQDGLAIADAVWAVLTSTAFETAVTGHAAIVTEMDELHRERIQATESSPALRVVAPKFIVYLEDT